SRRRTRVETIWISRYWTLAKISALTEYLISLQFRQVRKLRVVATRDAPAFLPCRCLRKLVKRLWSLLPSDTAARPRPRLLRPPLLHRRHARPPGDDRDASVT